MDILLQVTPAIFGSLVANFLRNTSRVLKAIELYKECVVLLNNITSEESQVDMLNAFYKRLYLTMADAYRLVYDHINAIECCENHLEFVRRCGDRAGEAEGTFMLAILHKNQSKYNEAKDLCEKALSIAIEIGDKEGEGACYGELGTVFLSRSEYDKAEKFLKKSVKIRKETNDKLGEAKDYGNLGVVFVALGEYVKAEEYSQKALVITKEIGDRKVEAACHLNLGNVFESCGEYGKAEEYIQKALMIAIEIEDTETEASCYECLGTVIESRSKYAKAEEIFQKALMMRKEIGDRNGEANCYANLGTVFFSLGQYGKAKEYGEEALAITKEIGDRIGQASCYGKLGQFFQCLGEYTKAEEYIQNAVAIQKEIGGRQGEASCYEILGNFFQCLCKYGDAKECILKALVIRKAIGDRQEEASDYQILGYVYHHLGEYDEANEYFEQALTISKEIGNIESESNCHLNLAWNMLLKGNIHEVFSSLFAYIQKRGHMRTSLGDHDQFKISFFDGEKVYPYRMLSSLFSITGNPIEALCVVELGRARALADLMSTLYSTEKQMPVTINPHFSFESVRVKEHGCIYLYISYFENEIFLWILKANRPAIFRRIDVNDCLSNEGSVISRNVDEVFDNDTFRRILLLPQDRCEDRSLFPSNGPTGNSSLQSSHSGKNIRLVELEESENQLPDPSLAQCYKIFIGPVADLLDEPELVIVPDRSLYKIPFPALSDESGKYLSESFRIHIVPSLTTLKLIQDSPADYHSETGALIVGEPKVSQVFYKGEVENLCPLPSARKEAEMIGRLLRVQPLLGQQATKQAVLQSIHSVGLIHFAAHGNAERGEIALAPLGPANVIPQEEEYLLSIADIAQVSLRAKRVVLSCCHSARGQIRSEGVIGIARAFLGSGARSVLVALWALEDKATEQFMSRFYQHLVRGESASESVHEAMKWMRGNGYSDVGQWAPFMLIGDNVTFDFGK